MMVMIMSFTVPAKLHAGHACAWPSSACYPIKATKFLLKPPHCVPTYQAQDQTDAGIICKPCNGRGWLVCDFCEGQKTNVKAENKRIYRRCPSCRAVGYVLCANCKVFKCVTFPNYDDGKELTP